MIVKRIYESDKTTQWYQCDTIIRIPKTGTVEEHFLLYLDKNGIVKLELKENTTEGFTIYIMEEGKTVDTFYWKLNN